MISYDSPARLARANAEAERIMAEHGHASPRIASAKPDLAAKAAALNAARKAG